MTKHTSESVKNTEKNHAENPKKLGRNDPCACGSGKKYKKCCLDAAHTHDHGDHHHCSHC